MTIFNDDLRINIAEFSNFIIRNYLVKVKSEEQVNEPHQFLYDLFEKLITGLADTGVFLGKLEQEERYNEQADLQQRLIFDAMLAIYLIEKANNESDLVLHIRAINASYLQDTINSIKHHATLFKSNEQAVEEELRLLREDHEEYFDENGSLRFTPNLPTIDVIASYLADNTHLVQFKNKFARAADIHNSLVNFRAQGRDGNTDPGFINAVIESMYLILLALTYIEPFFEMPGEVSDEFTHLITRLFNLQR